MLQMEKNLAIVPYVSLFLQRIQNIQFLSLGHKVCFIVILLYFIVCYYFVCITKYLFCTVCVSISSANPKYSIPKFHKFKS